MRQIEEIFRTIGLLILMLLTLGFGAMLVAYMLHDIGIIK